jgi:hypothetical protein
MQRLKVLFKELVSDLRYFFGRWVLAAMVVLVVVFLGFLFVVGNLVYPYRPLVVYSYTPTPTEVCPGDSVGVSTDTEIREDLRVLNIESDWVRKDSSTKLSAGGGRFEGMKAMPRKTMVSPFIRVAPDIPGDWQLETSYEVLGTRFKLPVRQDLNNVMAEDSVKILEANDEKCEGKP